MSIEVLQLMRRVTAMTLCSMCDEDIVLPSAVEAWIDAEGLIPASSSILVAFSGGPDSTALLDVLCTLASSRRWTLEAMHLHHGLRSASDQEAEHAILAGERMGVPVFVKHLRLEGGGNVQERAREARLHALDQRSRERGLSLVALGHTADDQAETLLMRLVRGTGATGLAGMAPRRGRFIRPLLQVRRREILAHLHQRALEVLEDPSNRDPRYLRSRARDAWIPLLEQSNPRVVEGLARLAENMRRDRAALEGAMDALLAERWTAGEEGELARVNLEGVGDDVFPSLFRRVYARAVGSTRRLQGVHVEQIESLWKKSGSRGIDLPGLRIELRYQKMVLLAKDAEKAQLSLAELPIRGPGRYVLRPNLAVLVSEGASTGAVNELPKERLSGELVLRGPLVGERMRIGTQETRRLSRIFIDVKMEQAMRAQCAVVGHNGEPVLVIGIRRAVGWTPAAGTLVWKFAISS
ncbi:MAG: tRNA lysidine(34) synthetase TilS [Deltaproteobacteria bacterium]|nr:tRNA lysidine(34) synthetase TilS [Deltaproteobacteria bacterium]